MLRPGCLPVEASIEATVEREEILGPDQGQRSPGCTLPWGQGQGWSLAKGGSRAGWSELWAGSGRVTCSFWPCHGPPPEPPQLDIQRETAVNQLSR